MKPTEIIMTATEAEDGGWMVSVTGSPLVFLNTRRQMEGWLCDEAPEVSMSVFNTFVGAVEDPRIEGIAPCAVYQRKVFSEADPNGKVSLVVMNRMKTLR